MKTIFNRGLLLCSLLLLVVGCTSSRKVLMMAELDRKEGWVADKQPISVKDWMEYMSWTMREYGDTSAFQNHYGVSFTTANTVLWDDAMHHFYQEQGDKQPMVGLTYEQCEHFCLWRTMMYNMLPSRKVAVRFKLPTQEQLVAIGKIGGAQAACDEYTTDVRTSTVGKFRCVAKRI